MLARVCGLYTELYTEHSPGLPVSRPGVPGSGLATHCCVSPRQQGALVCSEIDNALSLSGLNDGNEWFSLGERLCSIKSSPFMLNASHLENIYQYQFVGAL